MQPYPISYFKYDPAREIARLVMPVMKPTTATGPFGQWATYRDPSIPLAPQLVEEVSRF